MADPGRLPDDLQDLAIRYVLGELDATQTQALQKRAQQDPRITHEVTRLRGTIATLRADQDLIDLEAVAVEVPADVQRRARRRLGVSVDRSGLGALLALPAARLAIAAALLLGVVGIVWLGDDDGSRPQLRASIRQLQQHDPQLFGGFDPLEDGLPELERFAPTVRSRGLVALGPAGASDGNDLVIRWEGPREIGKWTLTVDGAQSELTDGVVQRDGVYEFRIAGAAITEPGTHTWTIAAADVDPPLEGTASFDLLDPAAAERHRAGVAAIRSLVDGPDALLLLAYWSLHRDPPLLGDAERYASAYVRERPEDAAGSRLLRRVLDALGSSRAGE